MGLWALGYVNCKILLDRYQAPIAPAVSKPPVSERHRGIHRNRIDNCGWILHLSGFCYHFGVDR